MPVVETKEIQPAKMPMEIEKAEQEEQSVAQELYKQPVPKDNCENRVLDQQQAAQDLDIESAIIFDWDDTLLASSFLSAKGYRLDNNMQRCPEVDAQLELLEKSVIELMKTAMKYGHICIITNAETGWVQMSAKKFIPGVLPYVEQCTIISARSTFEPTYPESPMKWKYYAFQERLKELLSKKLQKNIISFGDSHVEREAVRAVTRGQPNTFSKSVKFAERPSMEQLRRQVELVTNCFDYIFTHKGDLDLMLTISLMY